MGEIYQRKAKGEIVDSRLLFDNLAGFPNGEIFFFDM